MPTHDERDPFFRDYLSLSPGDQSQFRLAVRKMVNDLRAGQGFRFSLRVKGVQGHAGIFEMTWAGDGRATFQYRTPVLLGDVHIIWRRIGEHEILKNP
jgi:hypothetical protein